MTINQLLGDLGITATGDYSKDGLYEIILDGSNEWGKINTKLDKSSLVEPVDDSSYLNVDSSDLHFVLNDPKATSYDIHLVADFNEDTYSLVIEEKNG